MLRQRLKKTVTDNPKKVAELIDLVNLPTILRDFMGQSQSSRLNCFRRVWSYIKENNLQDPVNTNVVNCDEQLKSILLGKSKVDLTELPMLIKLHFPKQAKLGAAAPCQHKILADRTLAFAPVVKVKRKLHA